MSDTLTLLAESLDELVRSVPGVVSLFAADPIALRSAKALTSGSGALPLVSISDADDVLAIVISIGVDAAEQAPDTAAAVALAVHESLAGREVEVVVRISRVA